VGDFRSAYFNKRLYTQIADSMYNAQLARQTGELQVKYETEKKERLILAQQYAIAKRNYGLVAAMVLFVLGGWLVWLQYRRYQQKQDRRLQEVRMQQQRLATRAVMEAEERERRRIASDLHDGIGQMMSAAKMNLSGLQSRIDFSDPTERENFDRIMALVDESCKELRTVSHNMMPNALLKAGLASAVQEFVDKLDSRILQVNLYTEGLDQRLDAQVETVLYRIIQECVNNVIKHSGASLLDISLVREDDVIACTIEDNGQGFDVSAKQESGGGLGLKNLRARLDFLQGTMDIDSAAGKGTLVAMHIPLGGRDER
jgi:signal transduction histidine kinase